MSFTIIVIAACVTGIAQAWTKPNFHLTPSVHVYQRNNMRWAGTFLSLWSAIVLITAYNAYPLVLSLLHK